MNQAGDFLSTRQSLLNRLKDWGDDEGWRCFFETYWKLIYNAALRAGLTDPEAQDVVQETVLSVARSMLRGRYDVRKGSFKNWLLRLTRWRIADQLRQRDTRVVRRRRRTGATTHTPTIERLADPVGVTLERLWDQEWGLNLLEAALAKVRRKVDPKHYQVFDLHVMKEWPALKVARVLNLSPGSVYVITHRVNRSLRQEIARLEKQPL